MRDGLRSIDASARDEFLYDSSIGIVRALGGTQLAIEIEHVRQRGDRPGLNDPLRRHETIPLFQRHREAQPRAPRGKPKRVPSLPARACRQTSASPRPRGAEIAAHVAIHGRKTRPIARAFERFEIQLGHVDAIPAKAGNQLFYSLTGRAEAIALEGYVGVGCVQAHDLPEPIGAASVSPALSSV